MLLHSDLVHTNTDSFLGVLFYVCVRNGVSQSFVLLLARSARLTIRMYVCTCRRNLQTVAKTSLQAFVVAQVMQRGARLGVCKVLKLGLQLID